MFKRILLIASVTAVIGLLVFGAVNRTLARAQEQTPVLTGSGGIGAGTEGGGGYGRGGSAETENGNNGQGTAGYGSLAADHTGLLAAATGELSAAESAALTYVREEEKLARDVYAYLSAAWGLPVFGNIAASEQTHSEAVLQLLDRYGLTDPALPGAGQFSDAGLQALYDDLVGRGSQSLEEALRVGAAVEEIDIIDLRTRMAGIDNADILQVFNNLLEGSCSHLIAFADTLARETGEAYQPAYLSADDYQEILAYDGPGQGSRGGGYRGGRP